MALKVTTALVLFVLLLILLLPVFQGVRNWRPDPAWKNLKTINVALINYFDRHRFYPYHPGGADRALYAFSKDIDSCTFDSHPHKKPLREACWDHKHQRLVNSDFVYLNEARLKSYWPPRIILVERLSNANKGWVLVGLSDGRITSCEAPKQGYSNLLGNCQTSDGFWIKDLAHFDHWEEVQLPNGGSSLSRGGLLSHTVSEVARVDYTYVGKLLVERRWSCRGGTITEFVKTDNIGRIVEFSREPSDWRSFWPSAN